MDVTETVLFIWLGVGIIIGIIIGSIIAKRINKAEDENSSSEKDKDE